ncbi:hypothetical protein AAFX60_017830 [Aliivibrio fischeri]
MSALKTYDHSVYLLGAYFDLHDNGRKKEFRTWHQSSDLTEDDLHNIRPIPFTPVLVDDTESPVLWARTKTVYCVS